MSKSVGISEDVLAVDTVIMVVMIQIYFIVMMFPYTDKMLFSPPSPNSCDGFS